MISWIKTKKTSGWTAVDAGADALYGVTVLAPLTHNGKPRVVKCATVSVILLAKWRPFLASVTANVQLILFGGCYDAYLQGAQNKRPRICIDVEWI